jgi:putative membrane protein
LRPEADDAVTDPHQESDGTRRTHLAQERTFLAWLRSGLAAFAVAVAVGRLTPALLGLSATPFVVLGVGFGVLGIAFVCLGARRDRAVARDLAAGRFEALDKWVVWTLAGAMVLLGGMTVVVLFLGT